VSDDALPNRVFLWAGAAGPLGFVVVSLALAGLRSDVIERQGWVSWPSSLSLGGAAGAPMIAAFLWLGACYAVFAIGALRPAAVSSIAVAGYLVTSGGDALLALPTDAPGVPTTWHGALHAVGIVVATAGTLVVSIALLWATGGRAAWRPLRPAIAMVVVSGVVGLAAAFGVPWAKVVYVVGITLPAAVVPWCLARDLQTRSLT